MILIYNIFFIYTEYSSNLTWFFYVIIKLTNLKFQKL